MNDKKLIRIRVTNQSIKYFYEDGSNVTQYYDESVFKRLKAKYNLVIDESVKTKQAKFYIIKETKEVKKTQTKIESETNKVISEQRGGVEHIETVFNPFKALEAFKLTKSVYKRLKDATPQQCLFISDYMKENGLKRINDKVLDELGL